MFQTQYTLWLQSFSTETLDRFFLALSWLGYEQFLQAFIVFLIFGVNIRRGFLLSQGIIWTAAICEVLKDFFQYPRPFMIDSQVELIGQNLPQPSPITSQGGSSFWSLIPTSVVDEARSIFSNYSQSWGIPSGHAAGSIVIWGSLFKWYKNYSFRIICCALILLIPLSRLYVGMHFIGDLLAGYLVGMILVSIGFYFILDNSKIESWLFNPYPQKVISKSSAVFFILLVLPGCGALVMTDVSLDNITLILGTNFGFYCVWLRGVPVAVVSLKESSKRLGIGYIGLAIVLAVDTLSDTWIESSFGTFGAGIQEIILNGMLVFLGIEALVKLGFMKRTQ